MSGRWPIQLAKQLTFPIWTIQFVVLTAVWAVSPRLCLDVRVPQLNLGICSDERWTVGFDTVFPMTELCCTLREPFPLPPTTIDMKDKRIWGLYFGTFSFGSWLEVRTPLWFPVVHLGLVAERETCFCPQTQMEFTAQGQLSGLRIRQLRCRAPATSAMTDRRSKPAIATVLRREHFREDGKNQQPLAVRSKADGSIVMLKRMLYHHSAQLAGLGIANPIQQAMAIDAMPVCRPAITGRRRARCVVRRQWLRKPFRDYAFLRGFPESSRSFSVGISAIESGPHFGEIKP